MNEWQIDSLASLDDNVSSFKEFIKSQSIYELDNYFILEYPRIERIFQLTLDQLHYADTLPKDFLLANDAQVVAMTIDGDFIVANDFHTWVIERSFYIEDIECFILPINKWWIAYFNQTLSSSILSL
ncbi:hypothetical protein [Vagococcus xieshaowenii]|uniref:Uncharacterized protein n=1 Tax=Vagococcus xieshaowenii TaxID=2562451 RepID=A0AAJ5EFS8_9ENTE|nr:hypothetical protein [Vagococcus xieshaowenii]QCA29081.1 hypothetical protein E4Z98_07050 [Vagococcus xieshaowenii]TFZ40943.1 hypothetical protein E4031_06045 [Vagococcus xieshaowenii]